MTQPDPGSVGRSIHIGRDNYGIVVTGDGNVIVSVGELLGPRVSLPTDVTGLQRMLFRSEARPTSSASLIEWLSPDAGIVAVQPRRLVDDELLPWVFGIGEPVMRLVTGPGGQGKTVAGRLLCQAAAKEGWSAGFADLPGADWRVLAKDGALVHQTGGLRRWTQVIAALTALPALGRDGRPVRLLLVVDYAENQVEPLKDLLTELTALRADGQVLAAGQVRVLLLARSGVGWWQQLAVDHPGHAWVHPEPLELRSLTSELPPDDATAVWSDAVDAFAARYLTTPSGRALAAGQVAADSAGLAEQVKSARTVPVQALTTLDLYADALLGVLDLAEPAAGSPSTAGDPIARVLDHELRLVGHTLAAARLNLTPAQRDAALLTTYLRTAHGTAAARELLVAAADLVALDHDQLGRLAGCLAATYPGRDEAQFWAAPTPDRIPDTHLLRILQALPGTDGVDLLTTLAACGDPQEAGQVLTRLARARSTPGVPDRYAAACGRLDTVIGRLICTSSAGYLPAAVMSADPIPWRKQITDTIHGLPWTDTNSLDRLLQHAGFSITRAPIAVTVSERLRCHWRTEPPADDDARMRYAADIGTLATRLSADGRVDEALPVAQETVDLCQRLVAADPVFLPALATSVNSLALRLADLGRYQDALPLAQETVDLWRRLAATNPDAWLPALAISVNNLATRLADLGRDHEALPLAQEATDIRRRLAEAEPDEYLPHLAGSVGTLAIRLAAVGRREDALPLAQEAVEMYRRLVEVNPDRYLPDLAGSVGTLANRLADVGRREDALSLAQEAVEYYRRLAEVNPDRFSPDLTRMVGNLAAALANVGRREEALSLAQEAVEVYRRLVTADPVRFLPDLAGSVGTLATRLADVGRREDALPLAEEAVEVYRRLAEVNPDRFLPDLAGTVSNLALRLGAVGRRQKALPLAREAVDMWRQLAAANPDAFLPDLALSVDNLANRLADVGCREDAVPLAREAVDLRRQLVATDPDAFLPALAGAVGNLALRLGDVGRHQDALPLAREAVDLRRQLVAADPDAFLPSLPGAVNGLASALDAVGHREEALPLAQEAVELYRRLAAANPDAFLFALAGSAGNLAIMMNGVGRHHDALPLAQEAVDLWRQLAAVNPDRFLPDLAMSVNNLGNRLAAVGRFEDALPMAQEAVNLRRRLALVNPVRFLPDLAMSVNNLARRLDNVGRHQDALPLAQEAVGVYRRLASANPDRFLPDLAASANTLTTVAADLGHPEWIEGVWQDVEADLPEIVVTRLRLLRAGWEWVTTPTHEAARVYLHAHPELLVPDSETDLVHVLRYLPSDQARRFLTILDTARRTDIDTAYRTVPKDSSGDRNLG